MSQGIPSGLEGQIDSPNSLELIWERYKRIVITIGLVIVAAIGAKYAIEYMDRQATNQKWSNMVSVAGLDSAYAELPAAPDANRLRFHFTQLRSRLLDNLEDDLKAVPLADLESRLADAKGDKSEEPLLMWVLAVRKLAEEDYEGAKSMLTALSSGYPKHFLCTESSYPIQWRKEIENEEEDKKPRRPNEAPELEPAVAGSVVAHLVAAIDGELAFRAANTRFYAPVEPDSEKVAILEFADDDSDRFNGTLKIRFFEKHAPKHVAAFLKAAEEGFYTDLRVHNVARKGTGEAQQNLSVMRIPSELKFGLPITKTDDDRSKWHNSSGQVDESREIDWEDNNLSHFPGTLSAELSTGGKSQIERLILNAKDVALSSDGRRVIFGRVVEGLDFLERLIAEVEFQSETDDQIGRGVPADNIRIKSVTIQ